MRQSFTYILCGLLLVFFDFSINRLDILPDGLGFLLTAYGASRLAAESTHFVITAGLAALLAAIWLAAFFFPDGLQWPIGYLRTLLNVAMLWAMLTGIIEFATHRSRLDLAHSASNLRLAYVIASLWAVIAPLVLYGAGTKSMTLIILIVAPVVIVHIMILALVYRVSRAVG